MSERVGQYRRLQAQMYDVRARHEGADSEEEDLLLERMEVLWMELLPEEQAEMRADILVINANALGNPHIAYAFAVAMAHGRPTSVRISHQDNDEVRVRAPAVEAFCA